MAADHVAAGVEFANLTGGQEAGLPQTVYGDEEVASPAEGLQHIGDGGMKAGATVIESEEHGGRRWWQPAEWRVLRNGRDGTGGYRGADGFQVPFEILTAEVVYVGTLTG